MASSVRIVSEYQDFILLRDQWAELLTRSACNRVFFTHEWIRASWEAYGEGLSLYIVIILRDNTLLGIAPLCIVATKYRGLPVRKLHFITNRYTSESDFIIAKGEESNTIESIIRALYEQRSHWDILELMSVRESSPNGPLIENCLNVCNLKFLIYPSRKVPYIAIVGDWGALLKGRSNNFKKALRGRVNTIKKHSGDVRLERLQDVELLRGSLSQIYSISANSWKNSKHKSIKSRSGDLKLFNSITEILSPLGMVEIWVLYSEDTAIAFEYHVIYNSITAVIRADFDETYKKISPGAYLESSIIQQLFEDPTRPIHEYNTCGDGYDYLMRWTEHSRNHKSIRAYTNSPYGFILHVLAMIKHTLTLTTDMMTNKIKPLKKKKIHSVRD